MTVRGHRQLVAVSPDGQDARGLRRIGFDLRAQPVDVRIDGVFVALVLIPPNGVEQIHTRIHLAGVLREEIQQIEFIDIVALVKRG